VADGLIGREAERNAISSFLDKVSDGPTALVLEGEAGIGKTTLWKEAVAISAGRGHQILVAEPSESEASLPFATLGDLFEGITEPVLFRLPPPQRRALEVALLRAESEEEPAQQHLISVAVLSAIRVSATHRPLLLAVDDVQWADSPSIRVLQFTIRRLKSETVGILVSRRTPDSDELPLGLRRSLPSERIATLAVGPMTLEATDDLLRARLGVAFSTPTLTQLHQDSGGNPFFALEIGRFLLTWGTSTPAGQALPLPDNVRELVGRRLKALPPSSMEVLQAVSALSQATETLLAAALAGQLGWRTGLERAIDAHIIERHGRRLRFTHPLIRLAVYSDAPPERLRALHGRLAQIVTEPEERARHLALATDEPNSDVALALESAAAQADRRGAPDAAAVLAEQARHLTPPERVEDDRRRAMQAIDYHLLAGETIRARVQLEELLAGLQAGPDRAHGLHRLGRIRMWAETWDGAEQLLEQALTEAGHEEELKRAVERDLAMVLMQVGKLQSAATHARVLLNLAEKSREADSLCDALALSAMAECLVGNGVDRGNVHRAMALLPMTNSLTTATHRGFLDPEMYLGTVLKWTDDFEGSRAMLRGLLERLAREHAESDLAPILFQLGELECWAGNWDVAEQYAKQADNATRRSGQATLRVLPLAVTALVHALRGSLDIARDSAQEMLALTERSADTRFAMRALVILAFVALSSDSPGIARDHLGRVRHLANSQGYGEPGVLRFEGDEIEALVALGDLDEADRLTEELASKGQRLDRPWALATSGRCRGLLQAARGDMSGAISSLVQALEEHDRLQQPFELGRTLLALGVQQRRIKERRLARETLERALSTFNDLGAALWAKKATAELARIGGRQRGTDDLTATERLVAELVATGSSNREVASRLFISLKTVEANLSKIYQKLGLRSRSELAARLAGDRGKD
jgi:DNA-binding CsgD family transcriptional regulator